MNEQEFLAAMASADVIHDQAAIDAALDRMASELDALVGGGPIVYAVVLGGGLVVAGQLATRLRSELDFDYVHVSRYRGETQGSDRLDWICGPRLDWRDRDVVLVDDILDEGHTLSALIDAAHQRGARSVRLVTLCEKLHDRRVANLQADVVGLTVPDRFVFGYGMDAYERGRQLPGIYALAEG